MPIRTLPASEVSEQTLREMIELGRAEERTLDFKQEMAQNEAGTEGFAVAVSAMANADGGAIVYGAIEGDGDLRGVIRGVQSVTDAPDDFIGRMERVLRDGVREAIPNVEYIRVPLATGGFVIVVRVPASPRAPHMVTLRGRFRFHGRGTLSNDPMSVDQVREAVMRSEGAYDRIQQRVEERVRVIAEETERRARTLNTGSRPIAGYDFLAVHLLPLFPGEGPSLFSSAVQQRWQRVPTMGYGDGITLRPELAGLRTEYSTGGDMPGLSWTMLLRSGGIEFVQLNLAEVHDHGSPRRLDLGEVEQSALTALAAGEALAGEGFLGVPFALSLQLHGVQGLTAWARGTRRPLHPISLNAIPVDPLVISAWADVPAALRDAFHTIWQACGYFGSPWYTPEGSRRTPDA